MAAVQELMLIPSQKIRLLSVETDGVAFAKLFRSCWRRIPLAYRRKICATLRASQFRRIELSNLWCDSRAGFTTLSTAVICGLFWGCETSSSVAFGQVGARGVGILHIYFAANAFELLPTDAAEFIVAHELGHVLQVAIGRPRRSGRKTDWNYEREADDFAKSWGFNNIQLMVIQNSLRKTGRNKMTLQEACAHVKKHF